VSILLFKGFVLVFAGGFDLNIGEKKQKREITIIQGWRTPYVSMFIPADPVVFPYRVLRLAQAVYYATPEKRIRVIKTLLKGVAESYVFWANICSQCLITEEILRAVRVFRRNIDSIGEVKEGLGFEGNFHKEIFEIWMRNVPPEFGFTGRNRQPPRDPLNALISYGNSLMYKICVPPLQKAGFNTSVGFLHQPGRGRHTLALDIAELLKPVLVEAVIWNMLLEGEFARDMTTEGPGGCFLNKDGKKAYRDSLFKMVEDLFGGSTRCHFGWPINLLKALEETVARISRDLIQETIPESWVVFRR